MNDPINPVRGVVVGFGGAVLASLLVLAWAAPSAQAVLFMVDVRASGVSGPGLRFDSAKHVTIDGAINPGVSQITLDVFAQVYGSDSNSGNEAFQDAYGSFLSTNLSNAVIGGVVRGNLSFTLAAPFNDPPAASNGLTADLDGDSDLDIGSTNNISATGFVLAHSANPISLANPDVATVTALGNGSPGAGIEMKFGTLTFTAQSLVSYPLSGDVTDLNWLGRTRGNALVVPAAFTADGVTNDPTTVGPVGSRWPSGAAVEIVAVPEPAILGVLSLLALAARSLCRRCFRETIR